MEERDYQLLPDEQVMYEGPGVVVTSHRLMANFGRSDEGSFDESPLSDISTPKKYNLGKQSRRDIGIRLLIAGGIVLAVEIALENVGALGDKLAAFLFMVGAVGGSVGLYMIIGGMYQPRPNTTMVFPTSDGGEIVVRFTDWDSPHADELTRHFARAKRGF